MNKTIKNLFSYLLRFLSDKTYCKLTYFFSHYRFSNLKNPIFFNDKLLLLKLTERNPLYHKLVDKFEVRDFVSKKVGDKYLIPIIGVYNNVKDIDFHSLPDKFALKLTNGSQNNLICFDKSKIDWNKSKKDINKWLKKDLYLRTREWPYKGLKNKIIIEKLIVPIEGELYDYKFWCFNGVPKFVQIDSGRFTNHKRDFYNIEFDKKLDYAITYQNSNDLLSKPINYSEMLEIVKKISKEFKFVRVDLYNDSGQIYFGEITFYPGNCNEKMSNIKLEKEIGDLLKI